MSYFSDDAKNQMLDALSPDEIQLHSGDPGESGTDNVVGSPDSATFDPADGGRRDLSAPVEFSGLPPSTSVSWVSVWGGSTFLAKAEIQGTATTTGGGTFTIRELTLRLGNCE